MKRIIVLSTLAATMAVMLALAVALAGSASAANSPETVKVGPETGTELIADCGEFQVFTDFVVDGHITTLFDSDGNPDYYVVHLRFVDFFYNSETGEGFTEHDHSNAEFDLPRDEEVTSRGVSYRVTVPGEGVVLLQAGRLEFDAVGEVVFVAGPHQVLRGDTEKLCEALA